MSSVKKSKQSLQESTKNVDGEDEVTELPPSSRYASNSSLSKRPSSTRGNRDLSKTNSKSSLAMSTDVKSGSKRDVSSPTKGSPTSPGSEGLDSPNIAANKTARTNRRNSIQSQSSSGSVWTVDNEPAPVDDDRGRVKVFVRVRPINKDEKALKEENIVQITEDLKSIVVNDGKKDANYCFDRVFPTDANHQNIFQVIGKPVVHSALKGFNGTLMAYGQTGTGKTHTLTSQDGLIPRLVNYLFKRVNADYAYIYKIKCSCIQIYNEKIYDLLISDKKKNNSTATLEGELNLREDPEKGVFIEDLTEYIVRSPKEVFELIKLARSRLVFAETKMNRASSRSHAITFLSVEKASNKHKKNFSEDDDNVQSEIPHIDGDDIVYYDGKDDLDDIDDEPLEPMSPTEDGVTILNDYVLKGKITLCDLAGSERIKKTLATGDRLNEAQQINLSLLELGNVIHALTDPKRTHVPFRNSTLTRLLTESLGGNCLTRLIVCVGPCAKDLSETKGTLMFGMRAMRVKNNARVNMEVDYKAVAESLERQLLEKEDYWRKKENEWQSRLDEIVQEKLKEERIGQEGILQRVKDLELQLQSSQETSESLKRKQEELKNLLEKMSSWMSTNDAKIWSCIQAALYNLEQSVVDTAKSPEYAKAVNKHLQETRDMSAFIPKALSLLIDWLDECNKYQTDQKRLEKLISAAPVIFSSLNGNLKHHMNAVKDMENIKEFQETLENLMHGKNIADSPQQGPSAIHDLLINTENTSSLHFIAIIPLLLQYQMADRLLLTTFHLHSKQSQSQAQDQKPVSTQTHPRIPTKTIEEFVQTEEVKVVDKMKHDKDIDDEMLDKEADRRAAKCVVGGKECSIM